MITFKNIAGNKFLAVGTIQRKSALNGEKSLTGTLYDGKDVLNKIDKGWSLEFDGEPYVVTYFERNDNDNSVSFDAIHKFFWDMTKKVLYSSTEISGSHTIKWYLDQIFANTGYTYALNFSPAAIEKDNWGNKTRLSLFNDLITSIAGEFEINGTLISIFQNIGTDLSTIVRYGFNLSDMTLENDATSFVTYGEGFGAYADQQNQTGERVHVTYTSPLASVYGILQAEPIDDQRYTSQANLQAAVKAQVDASFSVSVQLSLYDLTAAGYPYKMANVGDWLTAVDENLDFKQRIRIISIDDEFSADGTRISYTVTAGDVGLTKKYQDANASMASQVANAIVSAGQASTDANFALIAANGKLTAYYVDSYDELPTTANEGDLGWVTSGDGKLLYIYTKKADGSYYWEKRIDPEMGDQIAAGVNEAVAQANAHTDEVKQGLSTDISTAKSQAASQASTAEASAKSAATSQFNQAQSALSAAKSDLTNSIASEASARNAAVAAANSQAQTYANQAKADAMSAASSADGVIRTAISSSANSLSATITQNKSSADSGISTAQTTAQAAVDGLKFKVSQTDYDQKTGDLSTKINDVKETADSSAQTIADIKIADGKQDSRMAEIENSASGLKSTVSDLSTEQGKQSGYISTLQQRADGFDATVTKVNNLQVGGRNLLLGTSNSTTLKTSGNESWGAGSIGNVSSAYGQNNQLAISFIIDLVNTTSIPKFRVNFTNDWGWDGVTKPGCSLSSSDPIWTVKKISDTKYYMAAPFLVDFSSNGIPGNIEVVIEPNDVHASFTLSQVKVETGNQPTDWTPAPEDLSSATAKAQLTADQATLSINNYKTDADGRISKAQAGVEANANAITQKVSQSDYNTKTGDLTTAVAKAQTTADGLAISVGNYKTINDNRVKAAETAIAQNAKGITLRATTSDLNSAKSDLNSSIAQVKITADSISNFVRDSSGNISSDFQTALSKTSIITDSTLATSIQKQTATQITSALTDNNGKIISLINQDTSGVQIAGKNIILDGNTTVTGDFYAKGGNFTNLNASNMTVGTLNGNQVNIANINANNITTGTISAITLSGLQYSIDLTKGEQKNWYTNNSNTYTTSYYKGDIQFTGSYSDQMAAVINNNPSTAGSDPYPVINIGVTDNSASEMSRINIYSSNVAPVTTVDGRKSVKLGSTSSQISSNSQTSGGSLGLEANEIYIGQGVNGSLSAIPSPSLVQIYAATTGTIVLAAGTGDLNIRQDASGGQIYSNAIYARTYSGSANMTVTSFGTLGRVTSASKYKLAITHYDELDRAHKLLSIKPARWFDKSEAEQYADELNGADGYEEHLPVKPHFGLIAEDLVEAGLEEFVSYGADGEVEGLEYERVWTTLIPLIKNMKERIEELESKGK